MKPQLSNSPSFLDHGSNDSTVIIEPTQTGRQMMFTGPEIKHDLFNTIEVLKKRSHYNEGIEAWLQPLKDKI